MVTGIIWGSIYTLIGVITFICAWLFIQEDRIWLTWPPIIGMVILAWPIACLLWAGQWYKQARHRLKHYGTIRSVKHGDPVRGASRRK